MKFTRRYILVCAVFVCYSGCSSSDITSPGDVVFPARGVSFRSHVEPLFTISCNVQGCHDAARPDNYQVDLTSWVGTRATNVVNQPGDTNCGLIRVVLERQLHRGYFGVPGLTENNRQGLKQWVIEGAQNN